ncbi:MAG: prepilin peptidase [Desulfuromonadales bacterium]|nr:prepilin peptidase [Desulfuromonadales bacterium]
MPQLPLFFYIFAFIFGAVVGSFLNVCIYRIPEKKSIVSPPSACPKCGNYIRWYDNIPVISFLILRGKCRFCKAPVSWRYPLIEALNGILTLLLFVKFGLSITFVAYFILSSALVTISFIDFDHQIIPDEISLSGIVIGFIFSFFIPGLGWLNSLLGILIGGGILLAVAYGYQFLTGKDGMGGGDIKLLAMLGAFLGWKAVLFIIFSSSLVGAVVGIIIMIVQKKDRKLAIPFGPYLALGALLYVFFGETVIAWYMSTLQF